MQLDGMHLTFEVTTSFGKLYGDGGSHALIADSGLADGPATTRLMLQGEYFSNGVRGLKLVAEAIFQLLYAAYDTCQETQQQDQTSSAALLPLTHGIQLGFKASNMSC
jgi:hypothetical protein